MMERAARSLCEIVARRMARTCISRLRVASMMVCEPPSRDHLGVERDVGIRILIQVLRRAASSGTRRTNAAAWRSPHRGACNVASRAAIDSSAAHIWIISMISRFDLRTM